MDTEATHAETLVERAGILAVEARKAIASSLAAWQDLSSAQADGGGDSVADAGVDAVADAADTALDRAAFPSPEALLAVATTAADDADRWLSEGNRLAAGRCAEEAAAIALRLETLATGWAALADRVAESPHLYDKLDAYARTRGCGEPGDGPGDAYPPGRLSGRRRACREPERPSAG
jgi:hypothetical protein